MITLLFSAFPLKYICMFSHLYIAKSCSFKRFVIQLQKISTSWYLFTYSLFFSLVENNVSFPHSFICLSPHTLLSPYSCCLSYWIISFSVYWRLLKQFRHFQSYQKPLDSIILNFILSSNIIKRYPGLSSM